MAQIGFDDEDEVPSTKLRILLTTSPEGGGGVFRIQHISSKRHIGL